MIADLRELIAKQPFVPFTIHTVDGGAMRVPTLDHVHITPNAGRVFRILRQWALGRHPPANDQSIDGRSGGKRRVAVR